MYFYLEYITILVVYVFFRQLLDSIQGKRTKRRSVWLQTNEKSKASTQKNESFTMK